MSYGIKSIELTLYARRGELEGNYLNTFELHQLLGIKQRYSKWVSNLIKAYGIRAHPVQTRKNRKEYYIHKKYLFALRDRYERRYNVEISIKRKK